MNDLIWGRCFSIPKTGSGFEHSRLPLEMRDKILCASTRIFSQQIFKGFCDLCLSQYIRINYIRGLQQMCRNGEWVGMSLWLHSPKCGRNGRGFLKDISKSRPPPSSLCIMVVGKDKGSPSLLTCPSFCSLLTLASVTIQREAWPGTLIFRRTQGHFIQRAKSLAIQRNSYVTTFKRFLTWDKASCIPG